jgi:hypothetical protein
MAAQPMPPRTEKDEEQLQSAIDKHPKAEGSIGAQVRQGAKENA